VSAEGSRGGACRVGDGARHGGRVAKEANGLICHAIESRVARERGAVLKSC
jgi:hypothetical protein